MPENIPNIDIFEQARRAANSEDVSPADKHHLFKTSQNTGQKLFEAAVDYNGRKRSSPRWSKTASVILERFENIQFLNGEAELDLSVHEMDIINRILRTRMSEIHDKEMVDAFLNLNVDFKAASGMWSGVFAEYLRDQQT